MVCMLRAETFQSCLTLCSPKNCSPPGSSVQGILQARILEWVAFLPPGDLPDPGIKPAFPLAPAFQADNMYLPTSSLTRNCEAFPQSRSGRTGGFDPWVRKIPWRKKRQPNQYSCLENPVDAGAWWAAVPRVTKTQTRLSMYAWFLTMWRETPRADGRGCPATCSHAPPRRRMTVFCASSRDRLRPS